MRGDTNGLQDIFVRDTQASITTRVSVAPDGSQAEGGGNPGDVAISGDGRFVASDHGATNLSEDDADDSKQDVFLRDTGGPPEVSVGDVAVHEGDAGTRIAMFTVSLSEPALATVAVAFATANGTALGTDFTASRHAQLRPGGDKPDREDPRER